MLVKKIGLPWPTRIINHGEYETLYAHLSKDCVEEGQEVTTDTVLVRGIDRTVYRAPFAFGNPRMAGRLTPKHSGD